MDLFSIQKQLNRDPRQGDPPALIHRLIASGLFSGYVPYASGSFASLMALLIFLTPIPENSLLFGMVVLLIILTSIQSIKKFEEYYGHDPPEVTIDEWIGMWISLYAIPINGVTIVAGFLLFRSLDILKPFPAGFFNKQRGPVMVFLDDIIAAIYVNIVLRISIHFEIL